ncbi:hypothetical protein [Pectinatus frisingensis]|uniref:hypothetical protein n=1 Tax=Pectinatus frisingensis TaxID=865 RepID=UPI0018C853AE|nr:hypothetical protein [Pectinatus frisingensis]
MNFVNKLNFIFIFLLLGLFGYSLFTFSISEKYTKQILEKSFQQTSERYHMVENQIANNEKTIIYNTEECSGSETDMLNKAINGPEKFMIMKLGFDNIFQIKRRYHKTCGNVEFVAAQMIMPALEDVIGWNLIFAAVVIM